MFCFISKSATVEPSKSRSGSEAYNPEEPSIDVIDQPVKHSALRITSANQAVSTSQTRLLNTYSQFPPTTITGKYIWTLYMFSCQLLICFMKFDSDEIYCYSL